MSGPVAPAAIAPIHGEVHDSKGVRGLLYELRGSATTRCHEVMLGSLREHDRRTGGEFIRTLDAYLTVGCSPTAAVKKLHLHRNGMLYRLQRIRELVPVAFNDPEQRMALHVALRIGEVLASRGGAGDGDQAPAS